MDKVCDIFLNSALLAALPVAVLSVLIQSL